MKTPHVHAAIIKAWADGATIEVAIPKNYASDCRRQFDSWMITKTPEWNPNKQYRIKPEPKPDCVKIRKLTYNADIDCICVQVPGRDLVSGNVMFVFDGETGELKDVQLLAKE